MAVKARAEQHHRRCSHLRPSSQEGVRGRQTFRMISTHNPRGFGMQGDGLMIQGLCDAKRGSSWTTPREREEQILTAHAQVLTQRYGTVHQEALAVSHPGVPGGSSRYA